MSDSREVKVQTNNKHIDHTYAKLKGLDALKELIFNSLDASANEIDIFIKWNEMSQFPDEISILDNGKGFSKPNEGDPDDSFLQLGLSPKSLGQTNDFNRAVHGKNGEGRFKSLSLGDVVEWRTKTKDESTIIKTTVENPMAFQIIDDANIPEIKTPTGTLFVAIANQKNVDIISDEDKIKEDLEKYFLTIIQEKNIIIRLNGKVLSVDEHIQNQKEETLPEPDNDVEVKTIIWEKNAADNNRLFWCDKDYNTLLEDKLEENKTKTNYSVYIASDRVAKAKEENKLNIINMDPEFVEIRKKAKDIKDAFLIDHNQQNSEDIIETLKEEDIYPFSNETTLTDVEEQLKSVYDEILVKLNKAKPAIFKTSNKVTKKYIVQTLKVILEKEPDSFKNILENIIGLNAEEMEDFASILEKISLQKIIKTVSEVTDRIEFIHALKKITYDKEYSKGIKERSQLHKILEQRAWIFGNEFHLSYSDKSFNTIIKGIRSQIKEFCGEDEITGKGKIPDLFFTKKDFHLGEPRALIVELKRPNVKIGDDELNQIREYYRIVKENPEFKNYHVDLIVISSDVRPNILEESVEDPKTGLLNLCKSTPDKQVYVKTWADIIDKNEASLQSLKKELELNPTPEDSENYLNNNFSDVLNK